MPRKNSTELIATIGIDIGKNTFHLIGLDKTGAIVMQTKLSRSQLAGRLINFPHCLIGMEACSGAHFIGRMLEGFGHDVRLIPAQYVKPFLKGHKNDYRDAEAIAEAVGNAGDDPAGQGVVEVGVGLSGEADGRNGEESPLLIELPPQGGAELKGVDLVPRVELAPGPGSSAGKVVSIQPVGAGEAEESPFSPVDRSGGPKIEKVGLKITAAVDAGFQVVDVSRSHGGTVGGRGLGVQGAWSPGNHGGEKGDGRDERRGKG